MRKPLNRIDFRAQSAARDEQPMLNRQRTLRYDSGPLDTLDWCLPAEDPELAASEFNMDVTAAGSVGTASAVRPTQLDASSGIDSAHRTGLVAPQDDVQISSAARALGDVDAASPLHEARLAAIRAAIEDGSYETPGKLEAAVDRLLSELSRD